MPSLRPRQRTPILEGDSMKQQRRLRLMALFVFLATVLLISLYTVILQADYRKNTEDAAMAQNTQCADTLALLAANAFPRKPREKRRQRRFLRSLRSAVFYDCVDNALDKP